MKKRNKGFHMKKSNIIMSILGVYGTFVLFISVTHPDSFLDPYNSNSSGIIVNLLIFFSLFIIGLFFKLQEKDINTKEISFIAIYGTFSAVSRIPFAGMPSIQPCSYLIICSGIVFGPLVGFIIGANVAFLSNIFIGQGPWTIYQIIGWGLMGASSSIFSRKKEKNPNKWILAVFGLLWGYLYGWILNLWFWILYMKPLTIQSFIAANLTSIFFDTLHAISNFVFLLYFGDKTINILYRYRHRFQIIIKEPKIELFRKVEPIGKVDNNNSKYENKDYNFN